MNETQKSIKQTLSMLMGPLPIMIFLIACADNERNDYQILKRGFENPPAHARPKVYWWWLNGNVDTIRLKEELLAMKRAGISGVDIFEIGVPESDSMIPPGPAFMSAESLKAIKCAIEEAGRLDIEVGLNVASSWNAGGSWILPEHAAKSLYFSKISVKVNDRIKLNLPFPEISKVDRNGKELIPFNASGRPEYFENVAVLAVPANSKRNSLDTTRIINLSPFFDIDKEILDCQLPDGEWDIYRYVCSNSGEPLMLPSVNSKGPIIDHFDSAATRAHFMYMIDHLKPILGDFSKTALKSFYLASYEARGSVWTSTLPLEFKKSNGYDIYKFIPALFNPELFTKELTESIQSDFRKILSELMINNFYKKAKEISNSYGVKINSEAGGPGLPVHNVPAEPLKALGALDIPRGEFWLNNTRYTKDSINVMQVVKEISAASHIYNRGIVEEESFTSREHWQVGPFDLKPLADRAFCEGMNRVVVHGFSHNPVGTGFPGYVYHAGTHFNDKTVWWPKIKPFNDYLSRISYILQETDFVSDVLFYYGDKVPNVVGPKNERFKVGAGYDYEVINTEILVRDLTVQNGHLMLPGGHQFSVLALAPEDEINYDVLIKLEELAKKGAIITGLKPKKAVGPYYKIGTNKEYKELINQLWVTVQPDDDIVNLRNGKIFSGLSPLKILENLKISPDLDYADKASSTLDYIHYAKHELDFYLIRNTTDKWVSRNCNFRQSHKIPEIWNPVSGDIISVPIYHLEKNHISVPITLAPYGSCFVVFKHGEDKPHFTAVTASGQYPPFTEFTTEGMHFLEPGIFELTDSKGSEKVASNPQVQTLEGDWQVSFPKGWGAPESITFPELISWPHVDNMGVQYFSGTATYTKTFHVNSNVSNNQRIFLDLGKLSKVGEVFLNNEPLGITWAMPHKFDVTGELKTGNNEISIEIANNWSNRLTGDAIKSEKFTNTNITRLHTLPWAQVPLIESGLLGPVTIQKVNMLNTN